MNAITDHRKLYGLFHIVHLLNPDSILDFGGSLARNTMFSRRYWLNTEKHMDIPRESRLDSFDLFHVCHFPVFQQVYNHIYNDIEEILTEHYDIIVFIDIIPWLEQDVLLDLLDALKPCCSCFLIQFQGGLSFPAKRLESLGSCMNAVFNEYGYLVIQTTKG